MANEPYALEYLPIARHDINQIADYIGNELDNMSAADKLVNDMVKAAENTRSFPYSKALYIPARPLKKEYRQIIVRNYIMFYWVDEVEKVMTIARVIYGRMDYEKMLI